MRFEPPFFRGTSGSAISAADSTGSGGPHSHHTLNAGSIGPGSKDSPTVYLAILLYSVFFLFSLEFQFSLDFMTYLINVLYPSLFALRPLDNRPLTRFSSLLRRGCLRLRVSVSSLPCSWLLADFLGLLGSGLHWGSRKLIDKFFHIFGRPFSLSSPSLFQDFLSISEVLLGWEYLVDGIRRLVNVNVLRYKLGYGLFGAL